MAARACPRMPERALHLAEQCPRVLGDASKSAENGSPFGLPLRRFGSAARVDARTPREARFIARPSRSSLEGRPRLCRNQCSAWCRSRSPGSR